ncbi:MAG: 3-deoxy-7-phosphoheptulonate synthase [candidate division KSB1 bacterium]|nr:3-deoxy-7-phosphoheptulonate synthase [candidate division KSB1 bacterium]MDZ7334425.1 3-deoxy-7-phosphoheptulonate synthase [candidate division KSB1 bacterium]MDZ7358141.1 3-deoxy-7-phosphoheptulonate synthase [candidate division KSB1 bacterium]MDZ7398768.1 3-deoxy-7-phosphoheptulonate synthase [candidate division KSB1 bacterium]
MVIVMKNNATAEQIEAVEQKIRSLNLSVHRVDGALRTILGAIGDASVVDIQEFENMEGVFNVVRIMEPYKLCSRTFHPENSIIKFNGLELGGDRIVVMAGPCSIESKEQIYTIAEQVAKAGATILRGGAFKPRTSPYAYQGMGIEGLKLMRQAADAFDLQIVSEILEPSQIDPMYEYVDIYQVGARNMQNFALLKALSTVDKPVLLKRGMAATIEEFLMAAEYIMSGGNYQVILCERGIRTFEKYTRNTLDISAIPIVKKLSHLPIIADPSHGTGKREFVAPMARAAVASGADGLIIEVHHQPDKAMSDGPQSLFPDQFQRLMEELKVIAWAIGRTV